MGLRGTDVARQSADMILLDDAFPTIVMAVREGRVIFENIRRVAAYLLSCNASEVLVIGLAILAALPLPILPLQILYLNLVTDVFPAFALAMNEGGPGVLTRPPRDSKEPILGRTQWIGIALHSLGLAAATLAALALAHFWLRLDESSIVTVTFLTLAFAQLWHVFDMRDPDSGLLTSEIARNPWVWGSLALCSTLLVLPAYWPPLAGILHLQPPDLPMWVVILGTSLTPLLVGQAAAHRARNAPW
jgi:Ca2+-transporting ATPase